VAEADGPRSFDFRPWVRERPDRWKFLSLPLMGFLALPMVALLLRASPGRVWTALATTEARQAIALSVRTSLMAMALTVVLGTPVALLLAHTRSRWKGILDALIDLPVVLPPAVAGLSLLMAFGRRGLVGGALQAMGVEVVFTQAAVVMAQTFVASPLYVRAAAIGFAGVEPELGQAAAMDGASRWQVFRHVILPLSWSALVSGAAMTWARALGEFGATIVFAGNFPGRTQTMPLAIYLGFELNLDLALALSVVLLATSALALVLVKSLLQGPTDRSTTGLRGAL
jgi:molybdate transport system permease protein